MAQRLDLLDPAEVARLGGIEIVAEGVVEGFLAGVHRSPFRGFSVEFTEHRAYQAGDELRYLDWRILGRSDRLFVKQFEEETNLRAMILLDASRSMAWQGTPERLTKRAYADRLAAALALILLRQRDATGLVTFDEQVRQVIPARVKAGQWTRIVRGLLETPDGQGTLLDHSIFMFGSNMSNSDLHNNYPEPNILVGGGNGKMKLGGQHLVLPEKTPIANLHLTLLQKVGVERDKFGDSTGTIAEI